MANILEQPEQFKAELKDKWLDYYQENRDWLNKINGHGYSVTNAWFILGIITALESKSELKELLQYFLLVTNDCDSIIKALGLDFDPERELEERSQQQQQQSLDFEHKYLEQIREEIKT